MKYNDILVQFSQTKLFVPGIVRLTISNVWNNSRIEIFFSCQQNYTLVHNVLVNCYYTLRAYKGFQEKEERGRLHHHLMFMIN